ncbi:MAG TPA: Sip1-related alpha-galactosidase [Pyrinomonadaceae bacterium]|nr:Sip1-related alpha-galactosidase [Pyrinomonadaceae bacterium]
MTFRRALLLSLLVLSVSCVGRAEAAAAAPTVALVKGTLQVQTPNGLVFTAFRLRLRLADGTAVSGTLEEAGREMARDDAGEFERLRFRLKPAQETEVSRRLSAVLEVRRYARAGVLVASLEYEGPPLAPREGVQLLTSLDRFARGMAVKRFKLYWTSPVFFSDYRLLGPANQLVLWQQTEGTDYNLLVPLAGGGMVGEVGISEIEWRPEFRVAASSYDPDFAPRRIPLFAYAAGADPYKLPRETYETAFASTNQYGRLRWQKDYPEAFRSLGWCSWNAYGHEVTADKVVASVRSMREKKIPFGFVLVDDGWLSVRDQKLTAFDADESKFPGGMSSLARRLRDEYKVPHVGVWHTFQGYWNGVEENSEAARGQKLFKGLDGKLLPDPRESRGEGFYEDWYAKLKSWGYDFVKVDGQGNNVKFTDGLMPLFDSGGGSHRNLQTAAGKFFTDGESSGGGLGLINCMEMSLENTYNWHASNVARSSDDYQPELKHNPKDHVYQNAYNAYWLANFAYPDWDMFQSHAPAAEFHAVARAVSGGPVYFTDEVGKERPEILRRLAFSDGRLLMPDEPAQVTRDMLLSDPSIEPVPLKVFARVTRPGYSAGVVSAFNVNKSSTRLLAGMLDIGDAEWPGGAVPATVAVYPLSDGRAGVLIKKRGDVDNSQRVFSLNEYGYELFTMAAVEGGTAVFGLLDKYLSPAAVVSVRRDARGLTVRLAEAGEFGAWLARPPARVEVDGRALPASAYSYAAGLLRVPAASFGARAGEREVRIVLAR